MSGGSRPDARTRTNALAGPRCLPPGSVSSPQASHPSDLDAAAACGLRTCYVSRPLEYGPGRVVEATAAAGHFDLMVGDLLTRCDVRGIGRDERKVN